MLFGETRSPLRPRQRTKGAWHLQRPLASPEHPGGADKKMVSNGRTFESGSIIKAGEQLPTQQILAYCQPVIKTVKGWRDTPIFARSDWWKAQVTPPPPAFQLSFPARPQGQARLAVQDCCASC